MKNISAAAILLSVVLLFASVRGKTGLFFAGQVKAGTYTFEDKSYFDGFLNTAGTPDRGNLYDAEGALIYTGYFRENKKSGYGVEYDTDGRVAFEGYFKDGVYHGFGIAYQNGVLKAQGDYIQGELSGFVYINENGTIYEGYAQGGKQGYGVIFNADNKKVVYAGSFNSGEKSGEGSYYSNEPNAAGKDEFYDGQWLNGKKHGTGRMFFANGDFYIGIYAEDLRNGEGKYYYAADDEYYEGQWLNDQKTGRGILKTAAGLILYEGEYLNDMFHGAGTRYYLQDKKVLATYTGEFKNGRTDGEGMLTDETGVYTGGFMEGKKHGKGKFTAAKGGTTDVEYNEGEIVAR